MGIVDVAWMIYTVSSGQSYSSSFNIFAIIAGVLLRRGSLRTARFVALFAALFFAAFLGLPLLPPLVVPADLIQTYLRITPTSSLAGWAVFTAVALGVLGWVLRSLTSAPVRAAMRRAGINLHNVWLKPSTGFGYGAALLVLVLVVVRSILHGGTADRAIERARQQLGPGYRYFVRELSSSASGAAGSHVRASVIAYTDDSIESVDVEWRE